MKVSMHSVHDVWTDEELLSDVLIARIEECGHYSPYNEEWQCLSTMIDYALKTALAKKDEPTSRLLAKLSEIGYVPLDRISGSPTVKFGALTLSDDGTVGVNEEGVAQAEPSTHSLCIHTSLDVYLTGRCYPVFSIILRNKKEPIFAISPDSKKLAIIHDDWVTVWGLADCRIIFRTTCIDKENRNRNLLWSRNSQKIVITHGFGFRIIPIDGSEESEISALVEKKNTNIITNDDASEFYYCEGGIIYHATCEGFARAVDDSDMEFGSCYLLRNRDGYWALIDGLAYRLEGDNLTFVGGVDPQIDTDPHRFGEIVADFMSQELSENNHYDRNSMIEVDGSNVVFKTVLRSRCTHYCIISTKDLSVEKYIGKEERTEFLRDDEDRVESIDKKYGFRVTHPIKGELSRFFLIENGKEIPLGTCRFDATAVILKGKLFIHKGTTIEVYDLRDHRLLLSTMAIDADRWIICGTDGNGTVSLAKVEDVESTIEEGSFARIRFGRMKAPAFKLDEFKDCYIEVNKVWNLKFSISIRDNILFYFNRDGNRVKPVTLNRYNLKSGNMKRSSTLKSDESRYNARLCELDGQKLAVVSLDDLDKNPSAEPRITIRIISCGPDRGSETCDITKQGDSEHLRVSSLSDAFVLRKGGSEYVVVQFGSDKTPLVCSRSSNGREHYPIKDGFVKGKVLSHDGTTCIIQDADGNVAAYDGTLSKLKDLDASDIPPAKSPSWTQLSVPLNKTFRTSFGTIYQNNGAFFCIRNSE